MKTLQSITQKTDTDFLLEVINQRQKELNALVSDTSKLKKEKSSPGVITLKQRTYKLAAT
jgi:hypothetical protein